MALNVESIHQDHATDQNHDPYLERAERMHVDQAGNVHDRRVAGNWRRKGGGLERTASHSERANQERPSDHLGLRCGAWLLVGSEGHPSPAITTGADAGHGLAKTREEPCS